MSLQPTHTHANASRSSAGWQFGLLLAGLLLLWAAFGLQALRNFTLAIGSTHEPTYDNWVLMAVLTVLGVPCTYFITRLLLPVFSERGMQSLRHTLTQGTQQSAVCAIAVFGTLVALFVRYVVMANAPMTDDEGSYQLAAQTLASGRLWVPSPRMPVFFDNGFVVNDGKLYSQYFYGWPLLLSLGVLVKLPTLVNPLLYGTTAAVIALICERRFGLIWGRIGALVYLSSPFLAVSAGTDMSHTSSALALTLLLWAVDRFVAGDKRVRLSIVIALSACLSVWIRPATGLGVATPLVFAWLLALPFARLKLAFANLLVFGLAAVGPALLFLWVNEELTGSPFQTGYHAVARFAETNSYRFVSFAPSQVDNSKFFFFFTKVEPKEILSKYVIVLTRLWTDSWGFPIGFSLALLATREGAKLLLGPFLGLLLVHVPLPDAGIDTFGPVHFTELMIPLTIASTDGLRRVYRAGCKMELPGLAPALLLASVLSGCAIYGIPRFTTLALLASDVRTPLDLFESAPEHSIVFIRQPFAPPCVGKPGSHFVFFHPNNDPDLKNLKLWANHIDLQTDAKLVKTKPGWKGYVMRQDRAACTMELVPLERASAWEFPPATYLKPGDLGEIPRPR